MNWLTNLVRPKIRGLMKKSEVPANLWQSCPGCGKMLFRADLEKHFFICHHCDHHLRLPVRMRLDMVFDNASWHKIDYARVAEDPLQFKDGKRYIDRLKAAQQTTGEQDAALVGSGSIGGNPCVVVAFDFSFMGGSMGMGVGEAILAGADAAVKNRAALLVVPASGGARMQEGILSLMQMARSTVAVDKVKEAGLPYLVLLTDPTTGGVTASFAMLGDITLAEPGSVIGFAGVRVIQETIRETLPKGFQRAEYLRDHGMVDRVVNRKDLSREIGLILGLLMGKKAA